MPASRRRRLLLCWAVLTLFFLVQLVMNGLATEPTRPFAESRKIDINSASIPELMSLPGMGRRRAAAVVLHRVRHGAFRSVDELSEVDGLGPMTVAALRPFLRAIPPGGR